jgi:hypothetical protein
MQRHASAARFVTCTLIVLVSLARPATAQTGAGAQGDDRPHPAEPDFKLVNLPTSLQMPARAWTFAMTHRFNSNLRTGSFTDQLEGLFGLDSGASIGLELRWSPVRRVQATIFRTNIDRTIQFAGRWDLTRQGSGAPVTIAPLVSVEGILNFRERHQPALGAVVSRTYGERVALYAVPMWVHNTIESGSDRDTTFIGLGGRLQIRPRTFVVIDATPRVAGYRPGSTLFGVGIEKRVGGHVFQLNVANGSATTYGQIARGGFPRSLYLGFNLTRKFY